MLRYETHIDLKAPKVGYCTSIVIYDSGDKPIAFVTTVGDKIIASTVTDTDFQNWFKALDLDKSKVSSTAQPF